MDPTASPRAAEPPPVTDFATDFVTVTDFTTDFPNPRPTLSDPMAAAPVYVVGNSHTLRHTFQKNGAPWTPEAVSILLLPPNNGAALERDCELAANVTTYTTDPATDWTVKGTWGLQWVCTSAGVDLATDVFPIIVKPRGAG